MSATEACAPCAVPGGPTSTTAPALLNGTFLRREADAQMFQEALSVTLEGGRAAPFHTSFMLEAARHTVPQTNRRHEAQTAGARLQADGGLELPGGLLPCWVGRGRHQGREDQREHARRGALPRQDRPLLPCSRAR